MNEQRPKLLELLRLNEGQLPLGEASRLRRSLADDGELRMFKAATTPDDPIRGVLD